MSEKPTHFELTPFGFEFGAVSVERLWSHNGYVAIRLLMPQSGKYVDVQVSPKGHNVYVTEGRQERVKSD